MKIIRILVYDGEEEWVKQSLAPDKRFVNVIFEVKNGKIEEYYLRSDFDVLELLSQEGV